jgi:hypothetical protein
VTAVLGEVLIIEWQRGSESWRATTIETGETYTIQLTSPEDGAMIEAVDGSTDRFAVVLNNCNPQVVPR